MRALLANTRASGDGRLAPLGKGRHLAGLNFGDCFAYATAALSNLPLLFKGNDFSQTDLRAA